MSTSGSMAVVGCSCLFVDGAGDLVVLRALLLFHLGYYFSIVGVVLASGSLPSSVVVVGPTDRLPWLPHRGLLL
jgi:hypothetical protein